MTQSRCCISLFSAELLEGIDIIDKCGGESELEVDGLLAELPLLGECLTAGGRADACMAVVDVHNGFLKRNKLVVVSSLGQLLGSKVRAVEAEGVARGECKQTVSAKVGYSHEIGLAVSHVFLRTNVMLEMLRDGRLEHTLIGSKSLIHIALHRSSAVIAQSLVVLWHFKLIAKARQEGIRSA